MRELNLRGVDLNLLVVLDVLIGTGNVTRAAAQAGMSQPAMSRALGRLRQLLGDAILVRGPDGLLPTPRALALQPKLKALLQEARGIISAPPFDASQLSGQMSLAATDHTTLMLMPRMMPRLAREAPRLDLKVLPFMPGTYDELQAGRIDLAFGIVADRPSPQLHQIALYEDHFVTLVRNGHPALGDWSREQFLAQNHVLVTIFGDGRGAVDAVLEQQGLARRIALRLPHFMAALGIVARTDLVVTLPASLARKFAGDFGLQILETPFAQPSFVIAALWSELADGDAASRWLREIVREEAALVEGWTAVGR